MLIALVSKLEIMYPEHDMYSPHVWASAGGAGVGFDWHTDVGPLFLTDCPEGCYHAWMNLFVDSDCNHGLSVSTKDGLDGTAKGQVKMMSMAFNTKEGQTVSAEFNQFTDDRCNWTPFFLSLFPMGGFHRTCCPDGKPQGARASLSFRLIPKKFTPSLQAVEGLRAFCLSANENYRWLLSNETCCIGTTVCLNNTLRMLKSSQCNLEAAEKKRLSALVKRAMQKIGSHAPSHKAYAMCLMLRVTDPLYLSVWEVQRARRFSIF